MVDEFVTKLLAGPPIALATSKKLLNQSFTSTLEEAVDAEGIGQAYQFTTKDTVEAMTAFVEKRAPRFKGR
jgi:2-(1,2-epoxy-1,2-dihydrophenyl)acetyl-CoA isomerase